MNVVFGIYFLKNHFFASEAGASSFFAAGFSIFSAFASTV